MQNDAVSRQSTPAYSALKLPIMFGSLAIAPLVFLLPIYAKQLGASAVGIGGLFTAAQCIIILLRPLLGRALDRFGRKGFFVAGIVCYAGAMGVFALASHMTVLYLAQFLHGAASACLWTAAYTITAELAMPAQQGQAFGSVDEYAHRGTLYGTVLALMVLSWLALHSAWRVLFLGYMACALPGIWLAWKQTPETRSDAPPQARSQVPVSWRLVKVLLLVFLSYLFTAMLRPVFLVFLQDEFTQNVLLLALAFLPATFLESFLPSHLGRLSDRWGRRPLIIVGLTWAGLSSIFIPVFSHLAWIIVFWTLKTLGLAAALLPQKALINDFTADTNRGTSYGLYAFASSLGAAAGPLLGGWMYEAIGHATPFFLAGIVCLASLWWVSLLWPQSSQACRSATPPTS